VQTILAGIDHRGDWESRDTHVHCWTGMPFDIT
jgi:hypothetical protein